MVHVLVCCCTLYTEGTHTHTHTESISNEYLWNILGQHCVVLYATSMDQYKLWIVHNKWTSKIGLTSLRIHASWILVLVNQFSGRNSYRKSGNTVHRMYEMRYGETITGNLNLHLGYFALIQWFSEIPLKNRIGSVFEWLVASVYFTVLNSSL